MNMIEWFNSNSTVVNAIAAAVYVAHDFKNVAARSLLVVT